MAQNLILLPVFAQVLLTFGVLVVLGRRRRRSMSIRRQTIQAMALARDGDWETPALLAANNFKNQFELPVLFYAGTAFTLLTRNVDMAMFLLAWIFVLSRLVHAAVHLGSNVIVWRGSAYLVGFVALVGLWGLLAVRVIWSGF